MARDKLSHRTCVHSRSRPKLVCHVLAAISGRAHRATFIIKGIE
jgi:hypothetical protein